jgi:hypothetical protein
MQAVWGATENIVPAQYVQQIFPFKNNAFVHTRYQEAKAGESRNQDQHGLHNKTISEKCS